MDYKILVTYADDSKEYYRDTDGDIFYVSIDEVDKLKRSIILQNKANIKNLEVKERGLWKPKKL